MHPNMKAKEILWGVIAANIHIMKNFRNYAWNIYFAST
jgi:hypothetical protein